ncbi:MAG: hypothetical protein VX874_15910 [Pseudomonadota bacterium]|nr:hypothetical protein [Pseudomonadota bacterium]
MAVASWPSDLPFIDQLQGLSLSGPDGNRRTFVSDAGTTKTRATTTAAERAIGGRTRPLTPAEFEAFENFWNYELAQGTLSFAAPHPLTGSMTVFKSDGSAYVPMVVGAGKVRVALSLVILP